MSISKWLISAPLVYAIGMSSACAPKAADQTTKTADTVDRSTSEIREAGEKVADDTKDVAQKIEDKTREIAEKTADKTKEIAGEITDGWITTKLSAKFVDEKVLKDSNINIDTNAHVVTLKGRVRSNAAKARATEIARGTEGVERVVNQLVVKLP